MHIFITYLNWIIISLKLKQHWIIITFYKSQKQVSNPLNHCSLPLKGSRWYISFLLYEEISGAVEMPWSSRDCNQTNDAAWIKYNCNLRFREQWYRVLWKHEFWSNFNVIYIGWMLEMIQSYIGRFDFIFIIHMFNNGSNFHICFEYSKQYRVSE